MGGKFNSIFTSLLGEYAPYSIFSRATQAIAGERNQKRRCPECAHSAGRPDGDVNGFTQAAVVGLAVLFVASYSASWGAVMNVFCNEIFPLDLRSFAVPSAADKVYG